MLGAFMFRKRFKHCIPKSSLGISFILTTIIIVNFLPSLVLGRPSDTNNLEQKRPSQHKKYNYFVWCHGTKGHNSKKEWLKVNVPAQNLTGLDNNNQLDRPTVEAYKAYCKTKGFNETVELNAITSGWRESLSRGNRVDQGFGIYCYYYDVNNPQPSNFFSKDIFSKNMFKYVKLKNNVSASIHGGFFEVEDPKKLESECKLQIAKERPNDAHHLALLRTTAYDGSLEYGLSSNKSDNYNMVVFGDSLSDTGNVGTGMLRVVDFVRAPYFNGAFSNGLVWHQHLQKLLPKLCGGKNLSVQNYAFGGAKTSKLHYKDFSYGLDSVKTLVEREGRQMATGRMDGVINDYLKNKTKGGISKNTFSIWIGANNYIDDVDVGRIIYDYQNGLDKERSKNKNNLIKRAIAKWGATGRVNNRYNRLFNRMTGDFDFVQDRIERELNLSDKQLSSLIKHYPDIQKKLRDFNHYTCQTADQFLEKEEEENRQQCKFHMTKNLKNAMKHTPSIFFNTKTNEVQRVTGDKNNIKMEVITNVEGLKNPPLEFLDSTFSILSEDQETETVLNPELCSIAKGHEPIDNFVDAVVGDVIQSITKLCKAGGKNFMVMDLPDISLTPATRSCYMHVQSVTPTQQEEYPSIVKKDNKMYLFDKFGESPIEIQDGPAKEKLKNELFGKFRRAKNTVLEATTRGGKLSLHKLSPDLCEAIKEGSGGIDPSKPFKDAMKYISMKHNLTLQRKLKDIPKVCPGVKISLSKPSQHIKEAIDKKDIYGLTNITEPAFKKEYTDRPTAEEQRYVDEHGNDHATMDSVHPTTISHCIIGFKMALKREIPGLNCNPKQLNDAEINKACRETIAEFAKGPNNKASVAAQLPEIINSYNYLLVPER